jgi:hypothetical protein
MNKSPKLNIDKKGKRHVQKINRKPLAKSSGSLKQNQINILDLVFELDIYLLQIMIEKGI